MQLFYVGHLVSVDGVQGKSNDDSSCMPEAIPARQAADTPFAWM